MSASMLNKVEYEGLVKTARTKSVRGGKIVDLFVQTHDTIQKDDGTSFESKFAFPVKFFGKRADAADKLGLGHDSRIRVVGKLRRNRWYTVGNTRERCDWKHPQKVEHTQFYIDGDEIEVIITK